MYDLRAFQSLKRCLGLCLGLVCLLGAFQVAHASKLPDFKQAGVTTTGNSARVGMTGNGVEWGSTIPISPTMGGWSQAGNYGIPQAAKGTTMNMSASGDVFFSGTKYPFQAGYTVPGSSVFSGLASAAQFVGGAMGGPAGLAIMVAGAAAPYIKQWFDDSGMRIDPTDPKKIQHGDTITYCPQSPCYEYRGEAALQWDKNYSNACKVWAQTRPAGLGISYVNNSTPDAQGRVWCNYTRTTFPVGGNGFYLLLQPRSPDSNRIWTDMPSMDDIGQYMPSTPFDPRVLPEILAQGGDVPMPAPTITGPSSLPGPQEVKRNSDGTTTTINTTNNYQTSGDTITNITNSTTTITQNSSSQVINSSTSTVTRTGTDAPAPDLCKTNPNSVACAPKDYLDRIISAITALGTKLDQLIAKTGTGSSSTPQPTDCDKKPNSVGCQDLDAPTGEIPKSSVALTYQPEDHFGGGSCPADKTMSLHGGPTVVVWDWAGACSKITSWVRPLLLALAAFGALMILAPGLKGDD